MNHVWWAIVRFFRKLFVPPELTPFERELIRQVSYLEGELHRAREKYDETLSRLVFGHNGPDISSTRPEPLNPPVQPVKLRAQELSELSKRRWEEHIMKIEANANVSLAEDEVKARRANGTLTDAAVLGISSDSSPSHADDSV